jgi:5-methylcytosine-specific restriction protein A
VADFRIVETRADLRAAQEVLRAALAARMPARPGTYTFGYPGGRYETSKLHANGDIWCFHQVLKNEGQPRYWNAFGLASSLQQERSNDITVEVNSPLEGVNRRIAGLFARSTNGRLAFLHTGRVGGGRTGVGKDEFLAKYRGTTVTIDDGRGASNSREALLLAHLDDPNAVRLIADFVMAVAWFKSIGRDGGSASNVTSLPMAKLLDLARTASSTPTSRLREVVEFVRSEYVTEYAKRRANGICDLCKEPAPFVVNGRPFLECHHIQRLADNGEDSPTNTVALCPNCHRRMHHAATDADLLMLKNRAR